MKNTVLILFYFHCFGCLGQAGARDTSFGLNGIGNISMINGDGTSIALQSDGKIIISGDDFSSYSDIVRYKSNGTIDSSFGTNGNVVFHIGTGSVQEPKVIVQPDNKIVVSSICEDNTGKYCFGIARLNTDGSFDNSFNGTGKLIVSFNTMGYDDYPFAIALQLDGKIVVVGRGHNNSASQYFAGVRINSNGTLDNSFGGGGKVLTAIGNPYPTATCVVVQPDGKIVVGGYTESASTWPISFAILRYNTDGTLDNSFGIGGKDTAYFGVGGSSGSNLDQDEAFAIALQSDGKIILTGSSYLASNNYSTFATLRYNNNGTLDNSFGISGKVNTQAPIGFINPGATGVIIQQDGKVVIGGTCSIPSVKRNFALVRYFITGLIDSSFGINGIVNDSITNTDAALRAICIQQDGKIIAGGGVSSRGLTIARYLSGLNVGVPPTPQQNNELLIYPNPADNNLYVHYLNAGEKPTTINIFDLTGKLILTKPCTNFTGDMDIDVTELPQGMYFVKVGSSAKKFVKE